MAKPQPNPASTRRKHTNLKLGCANCKRKKIRCDETLPQCGKCARGKREVCSYLLLLPAELNRIRLTHLLRNSQNKLLNHDYRLPTAAADERVALPRPDTAPSGLEFVAELTLLPLVLPEPEYAAIKFCHVGDRDLEWGPAELPEELPAPQAKPALPFVPTTIPTNVPRAAVMKLAMQRSLFVTHEFRPPEPAQLRFAFNYFPAGNAPLGSMLANGYYQPCLFPVLRHHIKQLDPQDNIERDAPALLHQIVQGKILLLDHANDLLAQIAHNGHFAGVELIWGSLITIGFSVMALVANKKVCLGGAFSTSVEYGALAARLQARLDELRTLLLRQFATQIQLLTLGWTHIHDFGYLKDVCQLLGVCLFLIVFIFDMLADEYYQVAEKWAILFRSVAEFAQLPDADLVMLDVLMLPYLMRNLLYNILALMIPQYDPTFVGELRSNLAKIEFLYHEPPLLIGPRFSDDNLQDYLALRYNYDELGAYLDDLLAIVATFDPDKINLDVRGTWHFLKRWQRIFPGLAMTWNPRQATVATEEDQFLADIKATLYMYYHATLAALEALFPLAKYLFITSFLTPTLEFYRHREVMTPHPDNYYFARYFRHEVAQVVLRHNYYAMRLFTFFHHRYQIYHLHITWKDPYPDKVKRNRLRLRVITNAHEVPITRFNNTLIRPEHYPTTMKNPPLVDHNLYLTRTDETLDKKFYLRNIERLDLFGANSNLQFDFATMMLLSDYRQPDLQLQVLDNTLGMGELAEFYEDRTLVLRAGMGKE